MLVCQCLQGAIKQGTGAVEPVCVAAIIVLQFVILRSEEDAHRHVALISAND